MDGAEAYHLYSTIGAESKHDGPMGRGAWSSVTKPLGAILGRTGSSADLGGSSEYSNEIFED
jgi:hypothetical protein